MFEGRDFPTSLQESTFESWLEQGRTSKISYTYLIILWDEVEENYLPVFVEDRSAIAHFDRYGESVGRQTLVAAYDLYSESRIV